jgi:hypothetical protein
MILLGVHVDLELQMWLGYLIFNLEYGYPALIVHDVSLVLSLHLGLPLLTSQLIVLVSL